MLFSKENLRKTATRWFVRMQNRDQAIQKDFEAWLNADQSHVAAYHEIAEIWNDFDSTSKAQTLAAAVQQQHFLEKAERKRKSTKIINSTLSLILAMGLGWFGLQGYNYWQVQPIMQMASETPVGHMVTQTLEDGSTLTLNANSDAEIRYYRTQRLVLLKRGEAIFEVKKDENRPFVVDAGEAKITVLGTKFSVNKLSHLTRVSVEHGLVKIEHHHNPNLLGIMLRKGEVAELTLNGKPHLVQRDAMDAFGFASGMVILDQADMQEVAETLSRYRQPRVIAQPMSASSLRITAAFKIQDTEKFLASIPKTLPVFVETNEDSTVIKALGK